jgi:hypothetical protein
MKFTQVTSAKTEAVHSESEPAQVDSGQREPERSGSEPSKDEMHTIKFTRVEPKTASESKSSAASKPDKKSHADDTDDTETLPFVPFPVECLPAPMRNIVKATQRAVGLKDSSTLARAS